MLTLRTLARRPGFSAVAILLLALGAGASTAVFSLVRSVLLRPLPYPEPDSLAAVWPGGYLAPEDMAYLEARVPGIESLAGASTGWMMALIDAEGPIKITADRVSDNFFAVLGARPALGRVLREGDAAAGRQKVAVLSDRFWRTRYGARPDVIGELVQIDEEPHEIVGVLPKGAAVQEADTDVWLPYPIDPGAPYYRSSMVEVIVRLAPGASIAQVDNDVRALLPALRQELKRAPDYGRELQVVSLRDAVVGPVRSTLLLLLASVAFVLLIAAVNHGTLMLSRSVERARELAIRTALGAGRWRVARLVVVEHLTLALLGAAAGIALAYAMLPSLVRQLPAEVPRLEEVRIDATILMVVIGASMVLSLVFTGLPMLMASRPQMARLLGQMRSGDSPREHRTLNLLVAAQIGLAVMLGIGAGLMLRSLWLLQRVDPGFDTEHVLTMRLQSTARYQGIAKGLPYVRQVLDRVSTLPGVRAVGAIQHLPLAGYSWTTSIEIPGRSLEPGSFPPRVGWRFVEGDYFRAIGIPLRLGRTFDAAIDRTDGSPVAIVNEALARRHFGSPEEALGQELVMRDFTRATGSSRTLIVGVVGDVRHEGLGTDATAEVYRPLSQVFMMTMAVVVRTEGEPGAMARSIREAAWEIDPNVPLADVQPLDSWLHASLGRPRLVSRLLLVFAAAGLALAVIGVYGVATYRVRQRQREIGVRMALGAAPAQVSALVLRQAALQAALGLLVGLPGAWALSRLLRSQLFGVQPGDPVTFASLPVLVVIVALLACALPAWRAMRIDPVSAIRED